MQIMYFELHVRCICLDQNLHQHEARSAEQVNFELLNSKKTRLLDHERATGGSRATCGPLPTFQ